MLWDALFFIWLIRQDKGAPHSTLLSRAAKYTVVSYIYLYTGADMWDAAYWWLCVTHPAHITWL